MDLRVLQSWDGKSIAPLKTFYALEQPQLDALVRLLDNDEIATAVSWLIKHHVENNALTDKEAQMILDAQRCSENWALTLHLLQCLDLIDLHDLDVSVALFVSRDAIAHEAPFVRAFALSAFAKIAATREELMPEARGYLAKAQQNEAKPSVKARLKRAQKYLDQS